MDELERCPECGDPLTKGRCTRCGDTEAPADKVRRRAEAAHAVWQDEQRKLGEVGRKPSGRGSAAQRRAEKEARRHAR